MKISYIDLNHNDFYESYSTHPKRYGGGRIFASWAKELVPDFHIYSTKESFDDIQQTENINNCHIISQDQIDKLKQGYILEEIIPDIKDTNVILHHFTQTHINTNKLQFVWSVGLSEHIHPDNCYLMLYSRERQKPILSNSNTVIFDILIGTNITDSLIENKKDDYVFQCTRHNDMFGSEIVAKYCNNNKIKAYFAGPIDHNYNFLKNIDNINTFYLGQIPEKQKIEFTKKARVCTFLHSWETPFNLSAIDSLGNGTPILSTDVGFWPDLIENGVNGFMIDRNKEKEFLEAWEKSKIINPIDCHKTVYPKYTIDSMIKTFLDAINSTYYIGYPCEDMLLHSNI